MSHSQRVFNFGAGPAALPEAVLQKAQQELLNWKQLGMSVMEISHRSKEFVQLLETTEADLRSLLAIPSNYRVLFLHGPARAQFSMIPMNLTQSGRANYAVTGMWSEMAAKEASKWTEVSRACDSRDTDYLSVLDAKDWQLVDGADYLYFTANETVNGLEFLSPPHVEQDLVCDMTSNLLSRPIDVSRYALIFAGSQKNIAPAGMTLLIVREDILAREHGLLAQVDDYAALAEKRSLLYTPPSFCIYMAGLMFSWLKEQGGLSAMQARNLSKSNKLYKFIDSSSFYSNQVDKQYRSSMNVVFHLYDKALELSFLEQAKHAGLCALKGHRSVGGMRASLYNAISIEAVDRLIEFMDDFQHQHNVV